MYSFDHRAVAGSTSIIKTGSTVQSRYHLRLRPRLARSEPDQPVARCSAQTEARPVPPAAVGRRQSHNPSRIIWLSRQTRQGPARWTTRTLPPWSRSSWCFQTRARRAENGIAGLTCASSSLLDTRMGIRRRTPSPSGWRSTPTSVKLGTVWAHPHSWCSGRADLAIGR